MLTSSVLCRHLSYSYIFDTTSFFLSCIVSLFAPFPVCLLSSSPCSLQRSLSEFLSVPVPPPVLSQVSLPQVPISVTPRFLPLYLSVPTHIFSPVFLRFPYRLFPPFPRFHRSPRSHPSRPSFFQDSFPVLSSFCLVSSTPISPSSSPSVIINSVRFSLSLLS